jgi:HEPN domain-containing protein
MLAAQLDETIMLTRYGVEFRYPGEYSAFSLDEAKKAVALADRVFEAIGKSLPENYLATDADDTRHGALDSKD